MSKRPGLSPKPQPAAPKPLLAQSILPAQASLGEGALWNPMTERLYWVDIEGQALHVFDPATGQDRAYPTGARIGTVVPALSGNSVLVALQTGIYRLHLGTGELTLLTNPLTEPSLRFNDGKCDPAGRLWVGTFDLLERPRACALYRLDADGSLRVMLPEVSNSNGLAWSLDQTTMYYVDTPTREVQAFDYDNASGAITNRRVVIRIPEAAGLPDGITLDAEDKLWIALWGTGTVARYDPGSGRQLQTVRVPAPFTSSCAFGGPDLETLYVTTARQGLSEAQLAEFPESGNVFAAHPGVGGLPANFYRG